MTNKGFKQPLEILKKLFPEDKNLTIIYKAKQMVCPLGMEVQKIHAFPDYCILYRGEHENLEAYLACKALRYKIKRDDPSDD